MSLSEVTGKAILTLSVMTKNINNYTLFHRLIVCSDIYKNNMKQIQRTLHSILKNINKNMF